MRAPGGVFPVRNYVSVYVTYWSVSSGPAIEGHAFGASQSQANGVALNRIASHGSLPPVVITDLGRFYFPLSQQIIGATLAIASQSPDNGIWNMLVAQEGAYDLTPQISPLKQGDYPYNPKGLGSGRKTTKQAKGMSLINYLAALAEQYLSSPTPYKGQEVLDVGTKFLSGKLTATQVYAALAAIAAEVRGFEIRK